MSIFFSRKKVSFPSDIDGTPLTKINNNISKYFPNNKYKQYAVLLSTGSFNPIHLGHIDMITHAKNALETQRKDIKVIGGFLSCSHDNYVSNKFRGSNNFIPSKYRNKMIQISCDNSSDNDWLDCDEWESKQKYFVDFPWVAQRLAKTISDTYIKTRGIPILVFYVCGTDHASKCGLTGGRLKHAYNVYTLIVQRPGNEIKTYSNKKTLFNKNGIVYVDVPDIDFDRSSTIVRDLLRMGIHENRDKLEKYLSKKVIQYLQNNSDIIVDKYLNGIRPPKKTVIDGNNFSKTIKNIKKLLKNNYPGKYGVLLVTGAFNPIHSGHMDMIEYAKIELIKKDIKVVGGFISCENQHKNELIPVKYRYEMIASLVKNSEWLECYKQESNEYQEICKGLNQTLNTKISKKINSDNILLYYVCGSDHENALSNGSVLKPFGVRTIIVQRPGFELQKNLCNDPNMIRVKIPDINYNRSSTVVRKLLKFGMPKNYGELTKYLNDDMLTYLQDKYNEIIKPFLLDNDSKDTNNEAETKDDIDPIQTSNPTNNEDNQMNGVVLVDSNNDGDIITKFREYYFSNSDDNNINTNSDINNDVKMTDIKKIANNETNDDDIDMKSSKLTDNNPARLT